MQWIVVKAEKHFCWPEYINQWNLYHIINHLGKPVRSGLNVPKELML